MPTPIKVKLTKFQREEAAYYVDCYDEWDGYDPATFTVEGQYLVWDGNGDPNTPFRDILRDVASAVGGDWSTPQERSFEGLAKKFYEAALATGEWDGEITEHNGWTTSTGTGRTVASRWFNFTVLLPKGA